MSCTDTTSPGAMGNCLDKAAAAGLAPNKRVDYQYGMVLGVDDFRQEQLHFEWKSRLGNLILHGYGTACGLKVEPDPTPDGDVEIRISPGLAVSPKGEWISVPKEQCARLGRWVRGHKGDLPGFAAGPQTAYVRLCYEECETDDVPVAGRPCATEDETRTPSRITESFRAAFSWNPPDQALEDDIRALGELLERVEVVDGPVPGPEDGGLLDLVRGLAGPAGGLTSPADGGPIRLDRLTACDTIRRALAVWVTEVRPAVTGGKCLPETGDDCILLARLDFTTDADGNITSVVETDERRRPILVPTRVLQELLPCCRSSAVGSPPNNPPAAGPAGPQRTFATLFLRDPSTVWAWVHHPNLLNIDPAGVEILTDGPQGTPPGPPATPAAVTRVLPGLNLFELKLAAPAADASVLTVRFDTAVVREAASGTFPERLLVDALADLPAPYVDDEPPFLLAYLPVGLLNFTGGDLAGPYPNPTVVGLRGRPVATTPPPNTNDVLTWNGAAWAPAPLPNVPTPTPTDTKFVRARSGDYAIAAAAWFSNKRQEVPGGGVSLQLVVPAYNDLTAAVDGNELLLNFKGYVENFDRVEGKALVYIVKATTQPAGTQNIFPVSLLFVKPEAKGLRVRLVDAKGEPAQVGFQVEISAYGKVPDNL